MKLKSLILGSVAAAGLSTAGYAADLGVLTSLDVCDALGLSGLTISSDTNCLQISGGVEYEFNWGDYRGEFPVSGTLNGTRNADDNDGIEPDELDWESQLTAWLKFVGTASSDFGPAKAVLKIRDIDETRVQNEAIIGDDDDTGGLEFQEAYVSIGDSTVIMAGRKGSIANFNDDEPFNYLGLFGSAAADTGVDWDINRPGGVEFGNVDVGGHVIQVVTDLGNGISAGIALENLNDALGQAPSDRDPVVGGVDASGRTGADYAGTVVGVLSYSGENITAHATGIAGGVLDGDVEGYAYHVGATGTFDAFKVRGALAGNYDTVSDVSTFNGLLSGSATFDLFTIALSGEVLGASDADTDYGVGGSIGATVTEGVAINLGARYYDSNNGGVDGYQVAAQLVAAVTETIAITGEIGVYGRTNTVGALGEDTDFYGAAELAWKPGGNFTSSLKGEAHEDGAYKVTFKAAKSFE